MEMENASSYVLEIIPDDVDSSGDYSIRNISGLVHAPRALWKHLNILPFCWDNENVWAEYYNSVSMVALRSMAPCKTYQKNRDNFVFLHAAELNSGTESVYNTVLAFYKTPTGRNRIADMQSGLNSLLVAFSIDAALFGSTAISDTAVDIVYDFMDKSYANWPALNNLNTWVPFANSFARAQNIEQTIVSPASRNTARPNGLLGFFSANKHASISYDLPTSHNSVLIRFANAAASGSVNISICQTRNKTINCDLRASTNDVLFNDVEYTTRYVLGDVLVVEENEGAIGHNLYIKMVKMSRLTSGTNLPLTPLVFDFSTRTTVAAWNAYANSFALAELFDVQVMTNNMMGYYNAMQNATITYNLPSAYNVVEIRFANAWTSLTLM